MGIVAYGAALIWDGGGGVQGVKAHNERVRAAKRAQALPLASVNADGTPVFGVHVRF